LVAVYTSIGDSGNISDETDTERQKIWFFNLDGSGKKLFASGIRNNEKLRIRPGTSELWGADHGSDWYGRRAGDREGRQPVTDLNPPCEFNHYVEGGFYGHPFVVGNKLPRLEFLSKPDINDLAARTIPPAWSLGAHWAPNGWTFLTRDYFPDHAGDAVIACHGSWNSQPLVGYRLERILFDKVTGEPYGGQWIVRTLGKNDQVLARPVDVIEAPDGSLLFTDNQVTKRVYRISKAVTR
jgi:glucose/arabinose dehydrogenase